MCNIKGCHICLKCSSAGFPFLPSMGMEGVASCALEASSIIHHVEQDTGVNVDVLSSHTTHATHAAHAAHTKATMSKRI